MTSEPVTVPPPRHPIYALTTFELRNYQRELEHALTTSPEHTTARELLQAQLAEVLTEQESRLKISGSPLYAESADAGGVIDYIQRHS